MKKQEQLLQEQYDAAQSFLDSVDDTYLMTQRSNLTRNKVDALRGRGAPPASWEGQSYDELTERLMVIVSVVGIIGSVISGNGSFAMPAFTGFTAPASNGLFTTGTLFPALFVTIACGAISGFHSLVSSGTTAKQISSEKDARPIGYGAMPQDLLLMNKIITGRAQQKYNKTAGSEKTAA